MNYDFMIDYKNDLIVLLGAMSIVCQYCLALKGNYESEGMCCLNIKIKLEEICPPSEPLNSLLIGDHSKHG
ncbi:ATP-dependent DNA helicase [Aphis craccivora]|uniref:ATP-dependent DNA helicase n=1 Tax=Aphis craccivora TaxID=307492 RepID=A0A6G0YUG1_APHCR|nr:ATP-dependent DNA helicase [Aphis craccivora]